MKLTCFSMSSAFSFSNQIKDERGFIMFFQIRNLANDNLDYEKMTSSTLIGTLIMLMILLRVSIPYTRDEDHGISLK